MMLTNRSAAWLWSFLLFSLPALALDAADAGMVKTVSGNVEIVRGAENLKAAPGLSLRQADVIRTAANSNVGLTLRDNTVLTAGPNSVLHLDKFVFDPKTQKGEMEATLRRGSLAGISGAIPKSSPDAVKFKTSTITMGVRGTEFIIEAADRGE